MATWMRWLCVGRLKLIEGQLYGKRFFRSAELIRPESITRVREYGCNNPMLVVTTNGERYGVRPWSVDCEEIVRWIEDHTEFAVSGSFVHRFNRFFYGRLFCGRRGRKKHGAKE